MVGIFFKGLCKSCLLLYPQVCKLFKKHEKLKTSFYTKSSSSSESTFTTKDFKNVFRR